MPMSLLPRGRSDPDLAHQLLMQQKMLIPASQWRLQINIDSLPYETIGECASFLCSEDCINLSKTSRTIYCATNSPSTLRELNIVGMKYYVEIHLNRFKQLRSIRICPADFNDFLRLVELGLDGEWDNDESDIEEFTC